METQTKSVDHVKSWSILSSRKEWLCSMLDNKIGRFYQRTKSANFIDRLTSS